MQAILQFFSLLATTLLLTTAAAAQPQTLHVGPEEDYPSIEAALSAADSGDVVEIHAGTYHEHGLVVDKPLHIRGIGYPVLDAQEQGEILTIIAHDVTVEGLQLQNVGVSYLKDHAGIRVRQRSRAVIRNNRLVNTFFGIYLERVHDAVIEDNELSGVLRDEASSGNGIHAWHCENLDIRNNWVTGHRDGIYFEFVDSSQIVGNESVGNQRYGLHFMFSNHDEYHHNRFADNGAGVAVMFSKFINMWENTFEHNWGRAAYGLLLKEIYDARIEDNHFIQNTIGINIEGSTRIVYQRNAFRRNGWAIKMAGGCLDNDITENNFRSNTLDLVVSSNVNNNTFDGNFWSEYNGYDLDRDGIGDVPYRPVKLFSYILDQTPEAIVLLRSFFVSLMNFSEKVSPVFTPANVLDHQPSMQPLSL